MADYDIGGAFRAIERELISSMMRNMKRHRIEEVKEKKEWEMWQALQLKSLEQYKKDNRKRFQGQFERIDAELGILIEEARENGNMDQEIKLLEAMRRGYKPRSLPPKIKQELGKQAGKGLKAKAGNLLKTKEYIGLDGEFFKLNTRKLEALIKATRDDMKKAQQAILRTAEDQYRKIIFNAQVYANTGAGTYEKAVDMATKDFLRQGIKCIEYKNGSRHSASDYADMAIRTASKRAYLTGEGEMRQGWGISTVIMKKRGNACPKCLPFVGKVLIDDVWSRGTAKDGPYTLMSQAMAAGLYHPNCMDTHTTYFEELDTPGASYTRSELKQIEKSCKTEEKERYARRQAESFERLEEFSLDPENQKKYAGLASRWNACIEKYRNSAIMKLTDEEQYALNQYISFESYKINEKIRNDLALSVEEKKMVENLDSALKKMPRYEGNLTRSLYFGNKEMTEECIKSFKIGESVSFNEFISATNISSVYNPDGEIQIFIQNAVMGRDITSINKKESEILYERGSKFKVMNVVNRKGIYYVLLEEI